MTALPAELAADLRAAWGFADATLTPLRGGLINDTFQVVRDDAPVAVLQRLHPVFAPEVNLDVDAVTTHLARRGEATPRLVRTLTDAAWVVDDAGRTWRALTWIDGVTVEAVPTPAWAEAGGALVGRFHRALADFEHSYAFARAGVHDTAAHLARLLAARQAPATVDDDLARDARALADELLAAAVARPALPALSRRHCHGDLKISNLRFTVDADAAPHGRCLLDLDTVGLGTLAFELGDALRSWCNPRGEDDTRARFDLAIFAAAMRGYLDVAGALATAEERASIVTGLETVCLELAARFCVDVFEDRYFGWDATRFPSRRAHCLVRARGQLALAQSVAAQRDDALAVIAA
ncbi:MAG: aminoglycoside phosphotransferase family protein [Kofleriaceae bacterium]